MKHVLIGKEVIIAPAALKAHRLILYKGNALLVNIAALFLVCKYYYNIPCYVEYFVKILLLRNKKFNQIVPLTPQPYNYLCSCCYWTWLWLWSLGSHAKYDHINPTMEETHPKDNSKGTLPEKQRPTPGAANLI